MPNKKSHVMLLPALLLCGACQAPTESSPTPGKNTPEAVSEVLTDARAVVSAISAAHANWSAGPTSMSALSLAARQHRLGVPLDKIAEAHPTVIDDIKLGPTPLPATFDWRNYNGQNFVSPILDQGDCGSCVGFSTTGTYETQLNIAANDPSSPYELSPQYLFACGGGSCDGGWDGDSAAAFVTGSGMPDDSCMPYTSGVDDQDADCNAACSDVKSRALVAKSYTTPTTGSASSSALKAALLKGPLVTYMNVYDDFMFYTGGVYKHVTGAMDGGHAVSIVGWNDTDQAWICRNSWGGDWGENGFFEVAYTDTSGIGQQTWQFTVAAPGAYVSLAGVRDHAVFSGTAQALAFDAASLSNPTITWTLSQGTAILQQGTAAQAAASSGASATIDTTQMKDGVYTLQAKATSGSTTVSSEPRTVYVLNGTETGSVALSGLKAGTTVSGLTDIPVTVTSSPVPFTSITAQLINSAGVVLSSVASGNVGPTTKVLGVDTTRGPNGTYTISVFGTAGTQNTAAQTVSVNVKN